ncbi:MAG: toxin-antitoxin system YwqK family antitoxin [Bacteroidetes bacterium]|nr:toxin-antitoxin system YwqK family antitoxin [Bacteroidota bacterium]
MKLVKFFVLSLLFIGCAENKTTEQAAPSSAGAPEQKTGDLTDLPAGANKVEYPDAPGLVGIVVGTATSKTESGQYFNGKRNGSWVQYYPNGLPMSITSYANGEKEGLYVEFGTNNNLVKRCYYHKGLRHGEYKEFNYTTLKEERNYVNGKIEGATKVYYDNGKVMEEGLYKNGLREGISKWYDQEGKLTIEYEYKNGELIKK